MGCAGISSFLDPIAAAMVASTSKRLDTPEPLDEDVDDTPAHNEKRPRRGPKVAYSPWLQNKETISRLSPCAEYKG